MCARSGVQIHVCVACRYNRAKASLTASHAAMTVKIEDLQRRMHSQAAREQQMRAYPPRPPPMYQGGFGGMPPPQQFEEPAVTQADVKAAEKQQSRIKVKAVQSPHIRHLPGLGGCCCCGPHRQGSPGRSGTLPAASRWGRSAVVVLGRIAGRPHAKHWKAKAYSLGLPDFGPVGCSEACRPLCTVVVPGPRPGVGAP